MTAPPLFGVYGAAGCGRGIIPHLRELASAQGHGTNRVIFIDDGAKPGLLNGHRILTLDKFCKEYASSRQVALAIADGHIRERLWNECKGRRLQPLLVFAKNTEWDMWQSFKVTSVGIKVLFLASMVQLARVASEAAAQRIRFSAIAFPAATGQHRMPTRDITTGFAAIAVGVPGYWVHGYNTAKLRIDREVQALAACIVDEASHCATIALDMVGLLDNSPSMFMASPWTRFQL